MPNPDGSQDSNAISLYETESGKTLSYDEIDGRNGTAALKITSGAKNLSVHVNTLLGGSENGIDLNHDCANVTVEFGNLIINGKYGVSAKTCSNVIFKGHLVGTPTQWAINLGSWSDQSSNVQSGTHLTLTADHDPIVVWVGNAEIPTLDDPSKYKIIGFGRYGALIRNFVMFLWSIGKKLHIA